MHVGFYVDMKQQKTNVVNQVHCFTTTPALHCTALLHCTWLCCLQKAAVAMQAARQETRSSHHVVRTCGATSTTTHRRQAHMRIMAKSHMGRHRLLGQYE